MRATAMALSLFLVLLGGARPAAGLELTAATDFLCDGKGAVDHAGRWNSGPVDAAWDLFIFGIQLRLRGLEAGARYELTDLDRPDPVTATGRQLLEEGLRIIIEERPGAAVVIYRKVD